MPAPLTQLLSRTVYATDGVTTTWDFSFSGGYLDKAHVKAYIELPTGERTDLTITDPLFTGPYQLFLSPALAAGSTLTIYRDTPKDLPLVDFADEGGLSEIALDTMAKQAIFVAAETTDTVNTSSSYDAEQAADQAATAAAAAVISANAAGASAVTADGHATSAGLSAVAAAASAASSDIAVATVAAPAKTLPVDGDLLPLADSAAANVLKKLSWANIKAVLKAYLDGFYANKGANTDITSIKGVPINQGAGTTTGNIAIGPLALISNTTGTYNISIGDSAGFTNTTGVGSITIGAGAGTFSNGVNGAVYIGHNSGLNATGVNNTFVGGTTGISNVAGHDNTFLGYNAGTANITGNGVTAVGSYALASTTTGAGNTAVGSDALFKTTGVGSHNTAVGNGAGFNNTTASGCTFIGYTAGFSNTTGTINTALGKDALTSNTTGAGNTALGKDALGNCSTGSGNIGLGGWTAALTYAPVFSLTTENNRIVMGSTAVTNAYVQVAWTAVSDARDKMDFTSVPHGLSFVNALQPISYRFRTSRGEDVPNGPLRYGFKAQDVLALEGDTPVIVDAEDDDKLRLTESYLIPVLVNAIQELSATVNAQAARIEALEAT